MSERVFERANQEQVFSVMAEQKLRAFPASTPTVRF
jgi:hypothetical protein